MKVLNAFPLKCSKLNKVSLITDLTIILSTFMRFHRTLTCGFLLLIYFIPRYLVINDLLRSLIYCFFSFNPPYFVSFPPPPPFRLNGQSDSTSLSKYYLISLSTNRFLQLEVILGDFN